MSPLEFDESVKATQWRKRKTFRAGMNVDKAWNDILFEQRLERESRLLKQAKEKGL